MVLILRLFAFPPHIDMFVVLLGLFLALAVLCLDIEVEDWEGIRAEREFPIQRPCEEYQEERFLAGTWLQNEELDCGVN